ncbi:hypothetical protein [Dictyobacter arantiisoli]|uniref:Uncharacterized protein n=1 Tax=Dictyobacter arantiisoli TaxID=2014874 RepID=A0A5A5T7Y4_9CHLR|nr:hypothetical protein [Dictyobacter arantiisoli]GCF07326.1 hypothetical protein KDI_08900 [Dictyobacter arantiisoli]
MGRHLKGTPKRMPRKEALDTLRLLQEKYIDLLSYGQFTQEHEKEFRAQLREAFESLTAMVYGPPSLWQYSFLCKKCHKRYAEIGCTAEYGDDSSGSYYHSCCKVCYDQLKTEGKLIEGEVQL